MSIGEATICFLLIKLFCNVIDHHSIRVFKCCVLVCTVMDDLFRPIDKADTR